MQQGGDFYGVLWGAQGSQPFWRERMGYGATLRWKTSIPGALRGKTNTSRQQGGGPCLGRGQSHQQASALAFQEASLHLHGALILLGSAPGRAPREAGAGLVCLGFDNQGKNAERRPGGDSPGSRSQDQGRSKHPEEKHENRSFGASRRGQKRSKRSCESWWGAKPALPPPRHRGAADTEPEGPVHPGAPASLGASLNPASPHGWRRSSMLQCMERGQRRPKGLGAGNLCPGPLATSAGAGFSGASQCRSLRCRHCLGPLGKATVLPGWQKHTRRRKQEKLCPSTAEQAEKIKKIQA